MQSDASPARSREDGAEEGTGPLRRCIVSHECLPKERLIRFVVDPQGTLLPDLEQHLPGRGLWLQARRDVVETACARGSFAKAARGAVKVPPALAESIEALLRRRCLDIIGLARRAGQLAAGAVQVRAWLDEGRAAVLVEAIDGAAGGRAKLLGSGGRLPLVALFTARELGAALGREQVVHVTLGPGALARRLLAEASRLAGFAAVGEVDLPAADEAGVR
ncbi:MAG TPA: RNA-binding protein [Alphaproteobacteria bacterium]|nr:RNA-binding protein [Alphaproteobacteria bacterium]